MNLEQFFQTVPKAAAAFSGGTDSAFLLWAARQYRCDVHAYYIKTAFQPEFELEDAKRVAAELDIPLTVIPVDILSCPDVVSNGEKRCYFCKKELFSAVKKQAVMDGYAVLIDGTNASDEETDRPGMKALKELGVRSPLRECKITKEQVRQKAREAGLYLWNKPAYACLATRIPVGRQIIEEELRRIEEAEDRLAGLGLRDFRVRLQEQGAKLQVTAKQMPVVFENRTGIRDVLLPLFGGACLDLTERSPSK